MVEILENRRLSAVMVADIVGFSARMEKNEEIALRAVTYIIDDLFIPAIEKHRGRLVKTMGDGLLAEFTSAKDAFDCGVWLQSRLERERRLNQGADMMLLRLGINLGDVIERKGDIFGAGVNIAARLEKICEPGGICIARNIYEQVRQTIGVRFDYAGRQKVRNIEQPIPIYQIQFGRRNKLRLPYFLRRPWQLAAIVTLVMLALVTGYFLTAKNPTVMPPIAKMKRALIDPLFAAEKEIGNRANIIVIPFQNLSESDASRHLATGLTEDLITDLAKLPGLIVLARTTLRQPDFTPETLRRLQDSHNVAYIIRGIVRHNGADVRINATLVRAKTGEQIWAERYDGRLDKVFLLQDQISANVIAAVRRQLPNSGGPLLGGDPIPRNHAAYLALVKGLAAKRKATRAAFQSARRDFQQALKLEPNYRRATLELAKLDLEQILNGWQSPPGGDLSKHKKRRARLQAAIRKITKDGSSSGFATAAKLATFRRQKLDALAFARAAIQKDPGDSDAMMTYGYALLDTDNNEKAIKAAELAMKLDPVRRKEAAVLIGLSYLRVQNGKSAALYFKLALASDGDRNAASHDQAAREGFALATSDVFLFAGFKR